MKQSLAERRQMWLPPPTEGQHRRRKRWTWFHTCLLADLNDEEGKGVGKKRSAAYPSSAARLALRLPHPPPVCVSSVRCTFCYSATLLVLLQTSILSPRGSRFWHPRPLLPH